MANECTKVELYGQDNSGDPRRYSCASYAKISKGLILKVAGERVASSAALTASRIAGIAAMDKAADDKSTSVSAWTNGVFSGIASGAITAGDMLQTATKNEVMRYPATTASSWAVVFGPALEDAATTEAVTFRLNI